MTENRNEKEIHMFSSKEVDPYMMCSQAGSIEDASNGYGIWQMVIYKSDWNNVSKPHVLKNAMFKLSH